jgi:hypothetical protein
VSRIEQVVHTGHPASDIRGRSIRLRSEAGVDHIHAHMKRLMVERNIGKIEVEVDVAGICHNRLGEVGPLPEAIEENQTLRIMELN